MKRIGVFDSGVGGENVVEAIRADVRDAEIVFKTDGANLPYGNKTREQLLSYLAPILAEFEAEEVDAIVIACNTASTMVLNDLRALTKIPLVGFEPMIKPAAEMTTSGSITVCATAGTLSSDRYAHLKQEFAPDVAIFEPDCSQWAELIEANQMSRDRLDEVVNESRRRNADVIVLGCTHYHWIHRQLADSAAPDIKVIQPTNAVISQLKRILA